MTLAQPDPNLRLFNVVPHLDAGSDGAARYAYGEAAQSLVCMLLGIEPIPVSSKHKICFDAFKDGMYYEIKSLHHKRGKVVLYKWRMEKDDEAGVPLSYLLVLHRLTGVRENIAQKMADTGLDIFVMPASVVHSATEAEPLRAVSASRPRGYASPGYREGYYNLTLQRIIGDLPFEAKAIENPLGDGPVNLFQPVWNAHRAYTSL